MRSLRWFRNLSLLVAILSVGSLGLTACTPSPTYTYKIRSAGPVHTPLGEFASSVSTVFSDSRGWGHDGIRFRQVNANQPSDFTVWIATANQVPRFSSGCSVSYSCTVGDNVVINEARWDGATFTYPWPLSRSDYRRMVVNHETGHWLGFGHLFCSGAGRTAPVMQQQSISLQGCRANPWPTAAELARLPGLQHH